MRILVAVLASLALAAGLGGPALASNEHPTQRELESQLVCPACRQTLDESDSGVARDMKAYIRKRIAEGATKQEITDELVADLGEGVIGVPRKHGFDLLAWVLPLGGIGLGAAAIAFGAWQWSRVRSGTGPLVARLEPALDPALERRVDEELRRFDG
jgi:cytochrome c-type biogenesis protein CcmH/NrfF